MTSAIGKYAAKKMLGKQMEKYKGKKVDGENDPFFAIVQDPRTGKSKKVKKQVPAYIPEHDAKILADVRKRAYKLDVSLFNLFGIRFGWDSAIGLVPEVGDIIGAFMAYKTISLCKKVDCRDQMRSSVFMLMYMYMAIDCLIGLVPFVGDLFDAMFKANTMCLRLLEKELDRIYKPAALKSEEEQLRKNKSSRASVPPPATVFEDFSDEEEANRHMGPPPNYETSHDNIAPPQPARVPAERRGEAPERTKSKGWFSSGSRKERRPDVEMGQVRNDRGHGPSRSDRRGSRR